jgi:hypothetical protein
MLRCKGVKIGACIREISFEDDVLWESKDEARTLSDALEILLQATQLTSVDLFDVPSPTFLSGLGTTCGQVLTSLTVGVCSADMMTSFIYIGDLTSLQTLGIAISVPTQWPHGAQLWRFPSLFCLNIELELEQIKHSKRVECLGLMDFICRSDLPLLNQFCLNLSTHTRTEQIGLCRFLNLHPEITHLDIFLEQKQWKAVAPHIRATNLIPLPVHSGIVKYLPPSVKVLELKIADHRPLEDLWDTLLALLRHRRNVTRVQVDQLEADFSWVANTSLNGDIPVREAQLIAGMLKYAALLKQKGVQLLDKDGTSVDDLMGHTEVKAMTFEDSEGENNSEEEV